MRRVHHRGSEEEPRQEHGRHRGGPGPGGHGEDNLRHGPDDLRRGPDDLRHGPGERGGPRERGGAGGRGRGRGRAQRGDVRNAILLLLAEQPMHGYQLMQAMNERTGGAWRPSPGAVYPTLDQLEDEGLATITQEGGRRLVTLTDRGTAHVAEHRAELGDPFTELAGSASSRPLREPLEQLHAASRQIGISGNATQVEAAVRVLAQARRSLYLILAAEDDEAAQD
jgi:DNA-binding PadR family transcriptional regulator